MTKRKVKFSLGFEDGYLPDMPESYMKSEEERTKVRTGVFHEWIPCLENNPKTGKKDPVVCALVEESCTGKMYTIAPTLLTFVDSIEDCKS